MKQYFKYMKGNWKYAILAPILMIIDTIGSVVQPTFLQRIIDVGIANSDTEYIIRTGIIMSALAIMSMAGGFLAMYYSSKAAYGFAKNLRQNMLDKIQEFSFSNINKFSTASLVTRLTNDVEIIQQLVQMMLRLLVRAPFMLIAGIILTMVMSPNVALTFVVVTPILAVTMLLVIKKAFPLFTKVQTKIDKVNSVIRENLVGARVVKSFVREDFEAKRFNNANDDLKNTTIKSFGLIVLLMPLMMLIMNGAIAVILWIGSNGGIEVGQLSASITYISITLISLVMLSMVFMNFSRAKASSDRILEVLSEEPDVKQLKGENKKIEKGKVEYNIKKFEFKDSDGEAILSNIVFTANPGETVAVIGSTGTGKSTLLNLMPRFYDVTEGYIKIDGIDVRDYDLKSLRDGIGMVPQENRLFSGTIEENIRFGKKDATEEEIKHACKIAQIDEYIESLPNKYASRVEERGTNFSGGQKQRLTIARALIKEPKILVLDDSVSALDSTTEANLRKALRDEFKNTTVFMVTQRINSCKTADKILVMDDGTIVGIGTHDELIKNNKTYQEINDSQKEVMPEE